MLLTASSAFSQNYSFQDLVDYKLLGAGPITSKFEVQGYYLFFEKDKLEADSTEFIIKLLDQNLNELTNRELTAAPNTKIEGLVFNGRSILLKQYKSDAKTLQFKVQNMNVNGNLELLGEKELTLNKHTRSSVHAVKNKGFVNIYGTKKHKANLEFYNNKGDKWTYETPDSIKWEELSYITNYENTLLFTSYRKNVVTNGGDYFLKTFDAKTGKMLYDLSMTEYGYDHEISRGFIHPTQEEIWLTGDYFLKGDAEKAENSKGLFVMKVAPDGDIKDSNYIPWNGKINRYAQSYKNGKIKDGFIYIHDFAFLKDGEVFGIGEQYRKGFRVGGLAEAAITAGAYGRLSKVLIGDLFVFKFGANGKLLTSKRNRKPEGKFIPENGLYGGLLIPGKKIGDVVAENNKFDFEHVSMDNEKESFTVFYSMKEKLTKKQEKQYRRKGRYILKTITYKNREWTKDKFTLSDGKGDKTLNILPAKPGYVLIHELSKDYNGLRLEKVK